MILLPITSALLLFIAAYGVGAVALGLVDRRGTLPRGAAVLFALGIGLGLVAHATLLLGLLGLARYSGWLLAGALAACIPRVGAPLVAEIGQRLGATFAGRDPAISSGRVWPSLLAGVALAGVGAVTFLAALTPPFLYDVLEYHVAGPMRWLLTGRVGLFPGNVYANMPCEAEMLYTAAMSALLPAPAWLAERAPGVAHWLFGASALAVMWAIMKRLAVIPPVRWIALALVATHPAIVKVTYDAYIDLAVMLWVGLALLAWLEWRARGERPAFALMFCFLGLGLCAKLTVASLYVLPALAILAPAGATIEDGKLGARRACLAVIAGAAIVTAVFAPWTVRAWIATGNPFFPALSGLFPTPHWDSEQTALFLQYHGQTFPWRWEYWRSLWTRLHVPGYWPMAGCAVALFVSRGSHGKHDGRRALAMWALAGYAVWCLALNSADRFILPALMAAIPVSAAVVSSAVERGRWRLLIVALWALLALMALPSGGRAVAQCLNLKPWLALPGETQARLWQARAVAPPEAARAAFRVNESLPDNARLLLVYEARFALFDRDVTGSTLFDRAAIVEALAGQPVATADDVRAALRRQGFTHVLIDDNDLFLFLKLFTQGHYASAREAAAASGTQAPTPEDFHLSFLHDDRYRTLRKPLLQFLRECRENPALVESAPGGATVVHVARL